MTESDQKRPLKVLMTSMLATGHLNACLGIGSLLKKRGHDVYFAHMPSSQAIVERQGMKFINLYDYKEGITPIEDTLMKDPSFIKNQFDRALKYNTLEQLRHENDDAKKDKMFYAMQDLSKKESEAMIKMVNEVKPDICLADYLFLAPWIKVVEVPTVQVMSTAPTDLYDGPPLGSGYSVNDPRELWDEYRDLQNKRMDPVVGQSKELFEYFGVTLVKNEIPKYLGIYIYPGPLDYKELGSPRSRWIRLDSAIRLPETTEFKIPEKLANKPGKLIYLSMGTLASMLPEMMNMVIEPLAKSPHRFIISTGRNGDSVNLYDNMWGDKYVNQVAILPHVDLFITHGGSNSMIEGLVAAKPLIVIPLFGDQLDNGQRVVDLGLGVKINFWEFSGEKLLEAIEFALNDEKIKENVLKISEELKKSGSSDEVCSMIEKLAITKQPPV